MWEHYSPPSWPFPIWSHVAPKTVNKKLAGNAMHCAVIGPRGRSLYSFGPSGVEMILLRLSPTEWLCVVQQIKLTYTTEQNQSEGEKHDLSHTLWQFTVLVCLSQSQSQYSLTAAERNVLITLAFGQGIHSASQKHHVTIASLDLMFCLQHFRSSGSD